MIDLLLAIWNLLVDLMTLFVIGYAGWACFYKIPRLERDLTAARLGRQR